MTADATPGPLLNPASAVCPEFFFLLPKGAKRGRSPDPNRPVPMSRQRWCHHGSQEPLPERLQDRFTA